MTINIYAKVATKKNTQFQLPTNIDIICIQQKIAVPWQSQPTVPLLVISQFFQTRSYLVVMKDLISGALITGIVRQMEHGAEMRHFVKVNV